MIAIWRRFASRDSAISSAVAPLLMYGETITSTSSSERPPRFAPSSIAGIAISRIVRGSLLQL